MTWAVYDNTTSIIYRIDNSDLPPEGEPYIELAAPFTEWPNVPLGLSWQVVGGVATYVDPRTLAQAKIDKIAEIIAVRDIHLFEPITVDGNTFAADANGQAQVVSSIQVSMNEPSSWNTTWTLLNNSVVTLSKWDLQTLGKMIDARTTDLYAQADAMFSANSIAGSVEQVAAVLVQFVTADWYYVGGVQTARPSLDDICTYTNVGGWEATGIDQVIYGSALPNPATVNIECSEPNFENPGVITVTDGSLELTATLPGKYRISIAAFPYKTKTIVEIAS